MANKFPVVGIGASAGGLDAVRLLLAHLPPAPGMAFVLIQHLDPTLPSELINILSRATAMPVVAASDGEEALPDHLYVIQPEVALEIAGGRFRNAPRDRHDGPEFLIDRFLRSLALDAESCAIAVILSGTGTDGALGICEVKAAGGVAIAQDETSAGHGGMPHAAAQSGCVDFVLPPPEIARRLVAIRDHHYLTAREEPDGGSDADYDAVVRYVRDAAGVDFSQYRATTVRRRILRRAMLFGHATVAPYLERLKQDAAEVRALHFDLLINVTSFFRDPAVFESLATEFIPRIVAAKAADSPIRVWVAGCSTGQEAYSIAMVLLESMDNRPHHPVHLFATDLSGEDILTRARAGFYPQSIEAEVTPARLRRFFDQERNGYRIKKQVRDLCIFAQQNITTDPPFSHLDLIACRNVLIYMSPALQQQVLRIFHYALDLPGYLMLGSSETVGALDQYFEGGDRATRIYTRKPDPPGGLQIRGTRFARNGEGALLPIAVKRAAALDAMRHEVDRLLLSRYAPPGVVIDEDLNVLEFRGLTAPYLQMPAGEPTVSLVKLAPEALVIEVRGALGEVQRTGHATMRAGLPAQRGARVRTVDVEFLPLATASRAPCFLLLFHDSQARRPDAARPLRVLDQLAQWLPARRAVHAADGAEIDRLQRQHETTREFMQSLLNERDGSNEELRAANEEIASSNEELQSTNEELQTAKEEVQSINEELTTVNEQLLSRNAELSQINNDFSNLLASTDIALVGVDAELRVRFYTPPATESMNLLPADYGRPIGHIRPAIAIDNLEELVRGVIADAQPMQRELRDTDNRWQSLRVYPYRAGDKIDGAVIVLVDIDDARRRQDYAQEAATLKVADQRKNEFLAMLGHELRNPLGPMANSLQILRTAETDPRQRGEMIAVLDRQLAQMTRIVEDLLDATRISQGKVELRREPLDVNTLLRAAVETSRPALDARDHRLELALCAQATTIDADPLRLTQVLVNLLNNAAKFTPRGGRIELSCRHSQSGGEHVEISVRDNGIGMSKDLLKRAFDLFTQAETHENRRRGGLGIGLTLARKLVELHGGSLEGSSAGEGLGSEFIVRLPVSHVSAAVRPQPAPPPRAARAARAPSRILVIEDNPDQAQTLAALLALWGYEVRTAQDGSGGVALAKTFNPDVVLVDIGLPGISGYEVARRLREDKSLRNARIIAQTGWGDTSDRRRTSEAGFDHHLLKPLDPDELRAVIERGST